MRLRHRWWNTSILCVMLAVRFHVSHAYSAVGRTIELYSCIFNSVVIDRDAQIVHSLLNTVAAFPIRYFTSVSAPPSGVRTLPRYVNVWTSSMSPLFIDNG